MATKTSSSQQISKTNARFAEVVASPGSGKTYTLILRLMHWLTSGVPAKQILVLSFSNAAVDELQHRIALSAHTSSERPSRSGDVSFAQNDLLKITVCTAHAFAKSIIKQRPLLKDKNAVILLRKAIRSLQKSCKKSAQTPHVPAATRRLRFDQLASLSSANQISRVLSLLSVVQAANNSVSEVTATAQFEALRPYNEVLRAVGKKYAAIKKKQGLIDYGDMLDQGIQAIADGAPFP